VVSWAGRDFSSYTYDALFTSDAPNLVCADSRRSLAPGSIRTRRILAGDLSVADFVISLAPGPWTLAMLAIQYSGLLSCPHPQQVTAMKRDARLCRDLGEYCSRRLPSSTPAWSKRIPTAASIHGWPGSSTSKGAAKLGANWGRRNKNRTAVASRLPNCRLSIRAPMDLSEFYAEIAPTLPNAQDAVNRVSTRVPQCYFGQGSMLGRNSVAIRMHSCGGVRPAGASDGWWPLTRPSWRRGP